jgi:predicted secreted hydrolase
VVVRDRAARVEARADGIPGDLLPLPQSDAESNPSRFSPKQLLFAHAALADPAKGKLLSAQRSARMLEGVVEASMTDTAISLDDWSLAREGGRYRTRVQSDAFALELTFSPTQPVLLQGEAASAARARRRRRRAITTASRTCASPGAWRRRGNGST